MLSRLRLSFSCRCASNVLQWNYLAGSAVVSTCLLWTHTRISVRYNNFFRSSRYNQWVAQWPTLPPPPCLHQSFLVYFEPEWRLCVLIFFGVRHYSFPPLSASLLSLRGSHASMFFSLCMTVLSFFWTFSPSCLDLLFPFAHIVGSLFVFLSLVSHSFLSAILTSVAWRSWLTASCYPLMALCSLPTMAFVLLKGAFVFQSVDTMFEIPFWSMFIVCASTLMIWNGPLALCITVLCQFSLSFQTIRFQRGWWAVSKF